VSGHAAAWDSTIPVVIASITTASIELIPSGSCNLSTSSIEVGELVAKQSAVFREVVEN